MFRYKKIKKNHTKNCMFLQPIRQNNYNNFFIQNSTLVTTEASYPAMTTTEDSDWLTHPPEVYEVRLHIIL